MKKFTVPVNLSFFAFSLLALFCTYISPEVHWVFALLAAGIPLITVLNFLLLISYRLTRSRKVFFPLSILLLFGLFYLKATVNVSFSSSADQSFQVLSYNVSEFGRPTKFYFDRFWRGDTLMARSRNMIDFAVNSTAEIKCFQEYYHDSASVIYGTHEKLLKGGAYQYTHSSKLLRINRARFGVAIFSKFPIVHSEELNFESENAYNRGVYADVLIRNDTVRVVNVHLESNEALFSEKLKFVTRWKETQRERARQADWLVTFIDASPYPVILCGDLNSTPYSYVYARIRGRLWNAFESEGTGIGATYNHHTVKFLRIDHQFYSKGISCEDFQTLNSVRHSNHFPIVGTYSIR